MEHALTAIGAFLAGLVSVGVPAVVYLMKEKAKINKDERQDDRLDRADAVLHYKEIADRLEAHVKRVDEQMQRQQDAISKLYGALGECRESEAAMYVHVQMLHDQAMRNATALRNLGQQVEGPPPLPPRPVRVSLTEEFEVRTTAQDSVLLTKVSESLAAKSQPPEKPA